MYLLHVNNNQVFRVITLPVGIYDGPKPALNIAAAFVVRTADGLTETVTPAFAAMMSEGN